MALTTIQRRLFALRDEGYAAFTAKLIPNIDPRRIIGVRSPQLAALAKELRDTPEAPRFLQRLPHRYLEENGLHAALLCGIRDYDTALHEVERLLPHVDNWGTCDSLSPAVFARHTAELLPHVMRWIGSTEEYTIRFGIGMLMRYYLEADTFGGPAQPRLVADIDRDEYYIRMMQAWYLATALAKQWADTLPCIAAPRPTANTEWVRRKAIQKALESRRITDAQKALLRSLRPGRTTGGTPQTQETTLIQ